MTCHGGVKSSLVCHTSATAECTVRSFLALVHYILLSLFTKRWPTTANGTEEMNPGITLTTTIMHGTTVLATSAQEKTSIMVKGKGGNITTGFVNSQMFPITLSEILTGIRCLLFIRRNKLRLEL